MISHDRWLLDRVATHILAFEDDGTQVQSEVLEPFAVDSCRWLSCEAQAAAAPYLLVQSRRNPVSLQCAV